MKCKARKGKVTYNESKQKTCGNVNRNSDDC